MKKGNLAELILHSAQNASRIEFGCSESEHRGCILVDVLDETSSLGRFFLPCDPESGQSAAPQNPSAEQSVPNQSNHEGITPGRLSPVPGHGSRSETITHP
jgi:hypothetical protein